MTPRRGRLVRGILATCVLTKVSEAQQASPLAGFGLPSLETTDVYVNVFLERLIDVDVKQYRHESIMLFGMSWLDPRARGIVENNKVLMDTENYSCSVPCWSNVLEGSPCCDGVYAPSFNFANAVGFSQDRQVTQEFYIGPDGQVMSITSVYGSYFQPMSFENYPFTSMDLMVALDFMDTSMFVEGHPGVTLRPSAAGPRVFELGLGDDSPQWNVQGVQLEVYTGPPLVDRIRNYATVLSNEDDPAPFAPLNSTAAFNSWVREQKYDRQSVFFIMRVDRFWQWNLVYGVLPVLLCAILGLLVFFQDPGDLGARISVIVTVFLAMTAIQFVLNDSTPQSTYIQPLQQCILIIYICFSVSAIESIVVYNMVHWKTFSSEREARKESWSKYKERLYEWRHYKTLRERDVRINEDVDEHGHREYGSDSFVDAVDGQPALDDISGLDKPDASKLPTPSIGFGPSGLLRRLRKGVAKPGSDTTGGRRLERADTAKPTVLGILREDSDYGKALAFHVDKWTFLLETLCYVIAIPVVRSLARSLLRSFVCHTSRLTHHPSPAHSPDIRDTERLRTALRPPNSRRRWPRLSRGVRIVRSRCIRLY